MHIKSKNMHLPENTVLQGGRYVIKRFISSGGFGCTYEAEHTLLEKCVAIKEFFVKDFCNRDEATAHVTIGTQSKKTLVEKLKNKFIDEAKALCKLQHPGIVRVFDVFEENGTAYYVMDYVDGLSLSGILKQRGTLTEVEALGYIRQVCSALKYVHGNYRLHLDIKPGNIMVDANGNAILIDFGASKQYDEANGENTSTLMGTTPGYAPLEQMGCDVVKFLPSTDIYALGATLYKLLTGVTPLSANLLASGETLQPLPKSISAGTRAAVTAAMLLNKQQRPQSIDEFLLLLDTVKEQEEKVDTDENTLIIEEKKEEPIVPIVEESKKKVKEEKPSVEVKNNSSEKKTIKTIFSILFSFLRGEPISASFMMVLLSALTAIFVLVSLISYIFAIPSMLLSAFYAAVATLVIYVNYKLIRFVWQLIIDIRTLKSSSKEERRKCFPLTIKKIILFALLLVIALVDIAFTDSFFFILMLFIVLLIPYVFIRDIVNAMRSSASGVKKLSLTLLSALAVITVVNLGFYLHNRQNVNYTSLPEAVDLGLSVKWAAWNVGATSPEEAGGYYAWGECDTKLFYSGNNYKHYSQCRYDISNTLNDVAKQKWGSDWRMPTEHEMNELLNKCTWISSTVNGVKCYKVTGPNGNSIYLPFAGKRDDDYNSEVGDGGYYWSGTYKEDYKAASLYFSDYNQYLDDSYSREQGRMVRAVTK